MYAVPAFLGCVDGYGAGGVGHEDFGVLVGGGGLGVFGGFGCGLSSARCQDAEIQQTDFCMQLFFLDFLNLQKSRKIAVIKKTNQRITDAKFREKSRRFNGQSDLNS